MNLTRLPGFERSSAPDLISVATGDSLSPTSAFVANFTRSYRAPALEELYNFGPHVGTLSFEVGNPDLRPEHAVGLDASLRWRGARASGEVTYFRNASGDIYSYSQMYYQENTTAPYTSLMT